MKIAIFGSGYVGLVTGVCFAEMGNEVICVDINSERVDKMNQGLCPIYEPGLDALIKNNSAMGRIKFTTDAELAIDFAEILFIAVGTPPKEDGAADMRYVLEVANTIGKSMTDYKVIVNKSTVPVGTADMVSLQIENQLTKRELSLNFDVVSNPEFLKEGCAISDCMKPDRIIIGCKSPRAEKLLRALYSPFNRNHDKLIVMDVRSAELSKYAANAMLATKISFMNEMSQIADRVGADIELVRQGIGSDPRIGFSFIYPGCGYGGSCFPKDVQALQHIANQHDYEASILKAVHQTNEQQKQVLLQKINDFYHCQLTDKTFAVWGLSFKPNTDDVREAPSLVGCNALLKSGAKIQAYDPVASNNFKAAIDNKNKLVFADKAMEALEGADALIIFTESLEFRSPDFKQMAGLLNDKVIFDGRNLYEPNLLKHSGLSYFSIGRPAIKNRTIPLINENAWFERR